MPIILCEMVKKDRTTQVIEQFDRFGLFEYVLLVTVAGVQQSKEIFLTPSSAKRKFQTLVAGGQ